ncbi:hypothetical protein FJU11_11285 [Pararhizobium mangrovi]|uniref:Uncharacterized protein n=1 Tax=Pararhizobium mangrovi TaxID=2590452 RepID=A0A506U3I0_9HYPH|nr:hypothetical protein FJU11_11285 [Pararhizobium mangrovi]
MEAFEEATQALGIAISPGKPRQVFVTIKMPIGRFRADEDPGAKLFGIRQPLSGDTFDIVVAEVAVYTGDAVSKPQMARWIGIESRCQIWIENTFFKEPTAILAADRLNCGGAGLMRTDMHVKQRFLRRDFLRLRRTFFHQMLSNIYGRPFGRPTKTISDLTLQCVVDGAFALAFL